MLFACCDDRAEPDVGNAAGADRVWHLALEHNDPCHNYGVYANGLLV